MFRLLRHPARFGSCVAQTRQVDGGLAALRPARLHGYEVKADADTLRRLPARAHC
ncbi:hypothetical protein OV208_15395 [Corallococcus sp. bb12-1]|uniref:hypothetical protein n=1 Tax=Corallococcus sp. bb12-1 TaxID=2996784 RepID=UPI0022714521|nr:hypothetical protein [Corallococcus sp. bb12-1]MCY1042708.1 hypothetical protein [Corallococcus sp. bb12-1]